MDSTMLKILYVPTRSVAIANYVNI